jgi:hypothetical protein
MDEHKAPSPPEAPEPDAAQQEELERVRALILQRRNRFIAAALAGIGAASQACSESHGPPASSVLPPSAQDGTAGGGGRIGPNVCLSAPVPGTGGYGGYTGVAGFGPAGAGGAAGSAGMPPPQVCLSQPIDECWNGQPPPCVCLEPPFVPDDDAGVDDGSQ